MSDCWPSYQCLTDNGYIHYSVNHSENFVDPNDPEVHTQGIESRWNAIKQQLKRKGTNVLKHMDEYLLEYCFKLTFKENIFDKFLEEIAKKYN